MSQPSLDKNWLQKLRNEQLQWQLKSKLNQKRNMDLSGSIPRSPPNGKRWKPERNRNTPFPINQTSNPSKPTATLPTSSKNQAPCKWSGIECTMMAYPPTDPKKKADHTPRDQPQRSYPNPAKPQSNSTASWPPHNYPLQRSSQRAHRHSQSGRSRSKDTNQPSFIARDAILETAWLFLILIIIF